MFLSKIWFILIALLAGLAVTMALVAPRRYLSDDVWGTNGKLMRVAAAPVLSKGRDRIVGAIYIGSETGMGFADRLKKNLDVDVALFLRGKLIASTKYTGELQPLPEM